MVIWVKKEQDNHRTVALGHITLKRLLFYLFGCPFLGTRITLLNGKNAFT